MKRIEDIENFKEALSKLGWAVQSELGSIQEEKMETFSPPIPKENIFSVQKGGKDISDLREEIVPILDSMGCVEEILTSGPMKGVIPFRKESNNVSGNIFLDQMEYIQTIIVCVYIYD